MTTKAGDIIALTEEQSRVIQELIDSSHDADAAFRKASEWIKRSNLKLFGTVHEFYPELKEFDLSLDHKTMEIVVLAKKDNPEVMEFARLYNLAKARGWID